MEVPPLAAGMSEFRTRVRPQPSAQPGLSDLPRELPRGGRAALREGGWTSGRDLAVEVEHVLENPLYGPRYAATLFRAVADGRPESQQAGQRGSRRKRLGVFEPSPPDGTKIVTIQIIFFFAVIDGYVRITIASLPVLPTTRLEQRGIKRCHDEILHVRI
jgi:hypothetical protein